MTGANGESITSCSPPVTESTFPDTRSLPTRCSRQFVKSMAFHVSTEGFNRRCRDCTFSGLPPPGASVRSCGLWPAPSSRRAPSLKGSSPSLPEPDVDSMQTSISIGASPVQGVDQACEGALVTGADYRGLGIVRSLGRRGIPVWVLKRDE